MTADERQQILNDHNTWYIGHKKSVNNRKQTTPMNYEINQQTKYLKKKLYANNKRLAYLSDENNSDKNTLDPSNWIKERKGKKKTQTEWSTRGDNKTLTAA